MPIFKGAFEIRCQNITLIMDSASLARRLLPAQLCLSLVMCSHILNRACDSVMEAYITDFCQVPNGISVLFMISNLSQVLFYKGRV